MNQGVLRVATLNPIQQGLKLLIFGGVHFFRLKVATLNPIQQGLKHTRLTLSCGWLRVATLNPIQQGLKPYLHFLTGKNEHRCNAKSNTTRIETPQKTLMNQGVLRVATLNPIQQGLKHPYPRRHTGAIQSLQR